MTYSGQFEDLCATAERRGVHVELYTDHRAKNARPDNMPVPKIIGLKLTDREHKTLFHDSWAALTTERLEAAARSALERLGVR